MTSSKLHSFCLWIAIIAATIFTSCARPGTPDGGPYDEVPPRVIGAKPADGQVNVSQKNIEIFFNEFVKLDKPSEKIIISPPQINQPEITAFGKRVRVKLIDSLKPNTIYTIDFGDAIVDNNESNPMGKYTYTFSTGDTINSMQVSGKVLNARNLEPIKGILVGLHSDTAQSAFTHRPFERVSRTNGSGEFTIKGVAPGNYHVYALQDADGDFTYTQKSEMIAFYDKSITPSSFADQRADTLWRDSTHIDSIKMVSYTHYLPDDIVLLCFNESILNRHLLKTERKVPEHFDIFFTAPSEHKPIIKGLNFNDDCLKPIYSEHNDTIICWIADTVVVHTDTLTTTLTYMENDSAGALVSRTDTINMISRLPRARQQKIEEERRREWQQKQEKLKKRGRPYQNVMPEDILSISFNGSGTLDLYQNIIFTSPEPIASVDTSMFHLYIRQDTLYIPADKIVAQNTQSPLTCTLYGEWRPEQQYMLIVDSAAFHSIYGKASHRIDYKFKIPSLDNYSTFATTLLGRSDTTVIVELLNSSDTPVRTQRTRNGKATFFFLKPGTYYMRAFIDDNGNGQWDEGNYADGRQAEKVYYYPTSIQLRAKWDFQQDWNLEGTPIVRQKPEAITKQKPDKERQIQRRNIERQKKWGTPKSQQPQKSDHTDE